MAEDFKITGKVVAARKLAAADSNGFSDPYCVVALLGEGEYGSLLGNSKSKKNNFMNNYPKRDNVFKTKAEYKTLNPKWWEEHFTFQFKSKPSSVQMKELLVEVWDWNRMTNPDFLGEVRIPLKTFNTGEGIDEWFPLQQRFQDDNVSGEVHLLLSLRQRRSSKEKEQEKQAKLKNIQNALKSSLKQLQLDEALTAAMDGKQRQRQKVITEMINTERSYVRDLALIQHVFINELRDRALLTENEIRSVFSNIHKIYEIHIQLMAQFDELVAKSKPFVDAGIATIFIENVNLFKLYAIYCSNHGTTQEKVQNFKNRSAEFAQFLEECLVDPECRNLPLDAFLIMPLQRMCKYPLLLRELLKNTAEDHNEYAAIKEAFECVSAVVNEVNGRLKKEEQAKRLLEIQYSMVNEKEKYDFLKSDRFVVKEGEAKIGGPNIKPTKKGYVILFNDIIALIKKKQNKDGIVEMDLQLVLKLNEIIYSSNNQSEEQSTPREEKREKDSEKDAAVNKEKEKMAHQKEKEKEKFPYCLHLISQTSNHKGIYKLSFVDEKTLLEWAEAMETTSKKLAESVSTEIDLPQILLEKEKSEKKSKGSRISFQGFRQSSAKKLPSFPLSPRSREKKEKKEKEKEHKEKEHKGSGIKHTLGVPERKDSNPTLLLPLDLNTVEGLKQRVEELERKLELETERRKEFQEVCKKLQAEVQQLKKEKEKLEKTEDEGKEGESA
ncbi:Rho guanine nucleotide exchange factor 4 [Balamuthia mandrillaris]